jgi:hypothetical protein
VEDVLEGELLGHHPGHVPGEPRVGGGSAYVEEEGAVVRQNLTDGVASAADPPKVLFPRPVVLVGRVADPEVVGRARDDDVGPGPSEARAKPPEGVLAVETDEAAPGDRNILEERQRRAPPVEGRRADG